MWKMISVLVMGLLIGGWGKAEAAQAVRYFKAEHGVSATYVRLATDGQYKIIDCEHMGIFLTDTGRWQQMGPVITFTSKDPQETAVSGH
jgi:hypothetical protein